MTKNKYRPAAQNPGKANKEGQDERRDGDCKGVRSEAFPVVLDGSGKKGESKHDEQIPEYGGKQF